MKTQIKNIVIWAENLEINESLSDMNIIVEKGELIGITGLNKEEKGTLISILSCFNKSPKGKYIFDYEDIHILEADKLETIRAEKIGCVFDSPKLFEELNVIQNVTFWLDCICPKKISFELGRSILKELGMEEKSLVSIVELSNMEKAIAALARAAINKPVLLLIDDIFSWLKPSEEEKFMELLLGFAEKGTTIIVLTNSIRALSRVNRVIRF